jgi:ribonuclease HI
MGQEAIARSVAFLRGYDRFLQDKRDKHHANPGLNSPIIVSDPITNGSIIVSNRNYTGTNSVWSLPRVNELKMNVDAAFCAKMGEAAAGIVVRDHLGRTIAAASTVLQNCANVEEAEATAIWSGLNFAVEHDLELAVLESDNSGVVNAVNNHSPRVYKNWHVFKNIDMLTNALPRCVISKVSRNSNGVAHDLARLAKTNKDSCVWLPAFISDLCNQVFLSVDARNE